jgi:Holliday junction DNA helicase RuvA
VAPWRDQLAAALVGLGWSSREADTAVAALEPVAEEQAGNGGVQVAVLLRQALQMLGRS